MTPCAVTYGDVTVEEVQLCETVRGWLSRLPDVPIQPNRKGHLQVMSCHMLARAVKRLVPTLMVVDGRYYPSFEHSWLLTPRGNILDVYPVCGASGPLLLVGEYPSPAPFLYRQGRLLHPFFSQVWFRQGVKDITAALRRIQAEETKGEPRCGL